MEKERKKENSTELQRSNVEAEVWLTIHIYIYTHKQNQNSPTKIKYPRLTWQTVKHKLENKLNKLTLFPIGKQSNEKKTNKYVERKGKKEKKG